MKVWLPSVRAHSGSDAYVERIAELIVNAGHQSEVTWCPPRYEYTPWLLKALSVPPGTDLIHANSWHAFAFAGRGYPLIATVHHAVHGVGYPDWKSLAQMLYHEYWITRFEAQSLASASAIVAVSNSTARDVERTYGVHGVHVIDNWLDTAAFVPDTHCAEGVGSPSVLFVGNLSRRKGGDLLGQFRRKLNPAIALHVVTGRRAKHAAALRRLPGTTIWSDLDQDTLIRLYQTTNVVVSLSRHEGFGYVALEAMACGKPVVAFDVAGIRDVVLSGVTGTLICAGDVVGVAAECARLVEDSSAALAMGRAGRKRAVDLFSPAVASARYTKLYLSLIET